MNVDLEAKFPYTPKGGKALVEELVKLGMTNEEFISLRPQKDRKGIKLWLSYCEGKIRDRSYFSDSGPHPLLYKRLLKLYAQLTSDPTSTKDSGAHHAYSGNSSSVGQWDAETIRPSTSHPTAIDNRKSVVPSLECQNIGDTLSSDTDEIEALWKAYLCSYGEPQVRTTLKEKWSSDPNVTQGRIQFEFPPSFQPGYIGPDFFGSSTRLIFLGYNPGEGRLATSQADDEVLGDWLKRFASATASFDDLCDFQSKHVVKWPIYRDKGIFRETDDSAIALLPKTERPSVRAVALLNLFPFKTVENKKPLSGSSSPNTSLKQHMWHYLIKPTLDLLAPKIIVHYPDADTYLSKLQDIRTNPTLIRAWHPSDYNVKAQRASLVKSWQSLADALRALDSSA